MRCSGRDGLNSIPFLAPPTPDTMTVFRREAGCGAFFLSLQVHRTRDSFTVEVAWTRDGSYPASAPLSDPPIGSAVPDSARFRMPELWLGAGADHWWEIRLPHAASHDMISARAQVLVADVIDSVQRFGVPVIATVEKAFCR